MTLPLLQVLLQALSSMAIAGGLIYTAFQFQRARKAQYFANFTRMVELQNALRKMRVDDPSLAYVYKHDVEGLANEREIREYFFNLMQLSLFEIVWFGHENGQIPEEYFNSWVTRMESIRREPSFIKLMKNPSMKIMHDDFQRFIDARLGAPRPDWGSPSAGRS